MEFSLPWSRTWLQQLVDGHVGLDLEHPDRVSQAVTYNIRGHVVVFLVRTIAGLLNSVTSPNTAFFSRPLTRSESHWRHVHSQKSQTSLTTATSWPGSTDRRHITSIMTDQMSQISDLGRSYWCSADSCSSNFFSSRCLVQRGCRRNTKT